MYTHSCMSISGVASAAWGTRCQTISSAWPHPCLLCSLSSGNESFWNILPLYPSFCKSSLALVSDSFSCRFKPCGESVQSTCSLCNASMVMLSRCDASLLSLTSYPALCRHLAQLDPAPYWSSESPGSLRAPAESLPTMPWLADLYRPCNRWHNKLAICVRSTLSKQLFLC